MEKPHQHPYYTILKRKMQPPNQPEFRFLSQNSVKISLKSVNMKIILRITPELTHTESPPNLVPSL